MTTIEATKSKTSSGTKRTGRLFVLDGKNERNFLYAQGNLLASAIASTLWCNRRLAASIQDLHCVCHSDLLSKPLRCYGTISRSWGEAKVKYKVFAALLGASVLMAGPVQARFIGIAIYDPKVMLPICKNEIAQGRAGVCTG